MNEYKVENNRIVSPGKFEGEHPVIPELWDKALNGCADDETFEGNILYSLFSIGKEETKKYPDLIELEVCYIRLWETDFGFVMSEFYNPSNIDELNFFFPDLS